ncbi:MAG: rhomboid family intramembrane serine protease [Lachnospira sp.]
MNDGMMDGDKHDVYNNNYGMMADDKHDVYNNNYNTFENKDSVMDDLNLDDTVYEIKLNQVDLNDLQGVNDYQKIEIGINNYIVTIIIILANTIAGIMCVTAGSDYFMAGGLNYEYIHNNKEYIRLLTYMFLHANFAHFINNMIALFIFGTKVESRLGSLRTAIIYFGSGLAGGLVSVYGSHFLNPDVIRYAAGASGAVFGVMCASLFLTIKGRRNAKKRDAVMAIVLIVVYALISNGANVDIFGHIGGGIAGGILALILSINKWEDFEETIYNKIAGAFIAIVVCVIAVSKAGIGTDADQLIDDRIETVRSQHVYIDEDVTFGDCLDNLNNAEWIIFTSSDDYQVVEYNGDTLYEGYLSKIKLQFIYSDENQRWNVTYLEINGQAQTSEGYSDLMGYLSQDYFREKFQPDND